MLEIAFVKSCFGIDLVDIVQLMFSFNAFLWKIEFYAAFKLKYPVVDIQLTKFQMLKPWFIRRLTTCNTCYYRYHTKLGMLLRTLNKLQKDLHGIHVGCLCICDQVCIKSSDHGCMAYASHFSR
jgi:hypothetical protein